MPMRNPVFSPAGNHVTTSFMAGPVSAAFQFDGFNPSSVTNTNPSTVTPVSKSHVVRLFNAGPSVAYIEFVGAQGDRASQVGTGIPLGPGVPPERFGTGGATYIAVVTAGGNATIYATPGEGQ